MLRGVGAASTTRADGELRLAERAGWLGVTAAVLVLLALLALVVSAAGGGRARLHVAAVWAPLALAVVSGAWAAIARRRLAALRERSRRARVAAAARRAPSAPPPEPRARRLAGGEGAPDPVPLRAAGRDEGAPAGASSARRDRER